MRSISKQWLVSLGLVALLTAACTYIYFTWYADLTAGPNLSIVGRIVVAYLCIHLVLWLPAALLSVRPTPARMVFISGRAAIFTILMTLVFLTQGSLDGPAAIFVVAILAALLLVLATDLAVLVFATIKAGSHARLGLLLWSAIVAASIAGWGMGVLAWSERMPTTVLAAASRYAGGRPYCLITQIELVDRRRDLTALAMRQERGYFTPYFHALMVIGGGTDARSYANWSYRKGRFVPLSRGSLNSMRTVQSGCSPQLAFEGTL